MDISFYRRETGQKRFHNFPKSHQDHGAQSQNSNQGNAFKTNVLNNVYDWEQISVLTFLGLGIVIPKQMRPLMAQW